MVTLSKFSYFCPQWDRVLECIEKATGTSLDPDCLAKVSELVELSLEGDGDKLERNR